MFNDLLIKTKVVTAPKRFFTLLEKIATHRRVLTFHNRFGVHGTEGRCYKLFLNYSVCVDNERNPLESCRLLREDYFECLHHKKEYARRAAVVKRLRELGGVIPELKEEKREEDSHH